MSLETRGLVGVDCVGIAKHEWTLCIEEGQVSLTTEECCETCWFPDGIETEFLAMKEMYVQVRMATDCPAYETDEHGLPNGPPKKFSYHNGSHAGVHGEHCDCNWWPIITEVGA